MLRFSRVIGLVATGRSNCQGWVDLVDLVVSRKTPAASTASRPEPKAPAQGADTQNPRVSVQQVGAHVCLKVPFVGIAGREEKRTILEGRRPKRALALQSTLTWEPAGMTSKSTLMDPKCYV